MRKWFELQLEKHPVRLWLAVCAVVLIGCGLVDSAVAHAQPPAQWDVITQPYEADAPMGWEPFSTHVVPKAGGYGGEVFVAYRRRVR